MKKLLLVLLVIWVLPLRAGAQSDTWHAWLYLESANSLVLLSPQGQIMQMPAPNPAEESPFAQRYFAISRDGAKLAMVSATHDDRPLVTLRDLTSAVENTWIGEPYDWYLPTLDAQHRIPTTNFSPDGVFFAVGLGNPDAGTWQVMVFETSSGAALFQLRESHPQIVRFVEAQPFPVSYVMPLVRLFEDARLHIQLVTADTQGISTYPSVVWSPGDDQIIPSDYRYAFMDIDPVNGAMVYPFADRNAPLPQSFGFVPAYNSLAVGDQPVWVENGDLIINARWAGANQAVLLQTQHADTFDTQWELLNLEQLTTTPLGHSYADLRGTPDGFLSVEMGSGMVAQHSLDNPTVGVPILSLLPGDDVIEIIWVQPPDVTYTGPR